jgi:hypothetical protein
MKHVQPHQPPIEGPHFAEEAMVDEPEAGDDGEADRVGEQRFALLPKRVGDFAVSQVRFNRDVEDQQGDRDREDAVAEGDDPRELDLVLLPRLRRLGPTAHPGIIEPGCDGTSRPARRR